MEANLTYLITGATGSFGKKCVETLVNKANPKRIIVYSRDELKQHEMRMGGFDQPCMRYFIGDVRDRDRLRRAMNHVDVVLHAAALKHVHACEYNPIEAIQTNVIGAQNIVNAAIDAGVKKVIGLSTDKAVNPVNLYGATKLCAEKVLIQSNAYSGGVNTIFSCVRYGNVLGSRGSVVPAFLTQRSTGKITITDERMTRFWLTLDQGVSFVLQCLECMKGGEIFIPKIPSAHIVDLADVLAPNCTKVITGIRPGEKLHECMLSEDEARHTIDRDGMFVLEPEDASWGYPYDTKAKKAPQGWSYTSDTNTEWLTKEQLKTLLIKESFMS
jgi:UDP-N-acetylglucosamine 4,6-dehydratase